MKKLITMLLIAILLNGFTPAAPTTCTSLVKISHISKTYVSAAYEIQVPAETAFEIHPLDILAFRFH
jgi:hypothetical protein